MEAEEAVGVEDDVDDFSVGFADEEKPADFVGVKLQSSGERLILDLGAEESRHVHRQRLLQEDVVLLRHGEAEEREKRERVGGSCRAGAWAAGVNSLIFCKCQ